MGNTLGGKRSAKVMKINGDTFKLKTPVRVGLVLAKHPGHVLLDSQTVMHYGVRAKPLEPHQELKPSRLYFLVQLPKVPEDHRAVRRVQSGIHMSAKDRLESLMLARRSASDLCIRKPVRVEVEEEKMGMVENGGGAGVRVKMRLPKAEVERLIAESRDGAEAAERIVGLCIAGSGDAAAQNVHWNGEYGCAKQGPKSCEKRVGFLPINEEVHF